MKVRNPEKGVALIIVLIVLMVMMAATVTMVRNSNVGMGIVGNLGFKQNATSVGDQGVEVARAWLLTQNSTTLSAAIPGNGYFETWALNFDPASYNWTAAGNSAVSTANDGTGNQVRYVIHRMCSLTGALTVANQECVYPSGGGSGSRQLGGAGAILKSSYTPFFRVTVRVDGPRNTLSFTQVMVY